MSNTRENTHSFLSSLQEEKNKVKKANQSPLPWGGEGGGFRLSPNFTLEELCRTSYPRLQDVPTEPQVMNLVYLCAAILQPLRDAVGRPVRINSGYRSARLNKYVGGVATSLHMQGLAADIHVSSEAEAKEFFDILKQNKAVDSVLFEHRGQSRWLHVQTRKPHPGSPHKGREKDLPRHIAIWNYQA